MAVYTPETKGTSRLRIVMSFILFAVLIMFTMSMNLKTNAFKLQLIEDYLLNYDYVEGVRDDVVNYAKDLYLLNGVSTDNLDEALRYRDFEQTLDAYFGFNITSRANYSDDTYLEYIDQITTSFKEDLVTQLEKHDKPYTNAQLNTVTNSFRNHLINTVNVDHLSEIKAVTNIGNMVSNVALSISILLIAVLVAIMYWLGNKFRRYRSVRTIGISFISAGIYDILFGVMSYIIFSIKHIDIFPLYLRTALMRYIYHFLNSVMITGGVMIFIAMAICMLAWKMRKGK